MEEAGPPSLYIVVSYGYSSTRHFSIIQLDTSELELENAEPQAETPEQQMKKTKEIENICEIHLNPELYFEGRGAMVGWLFSRPTSSTEDLYMVPKWGFRTVTPLCGYKLNFTTGNLLPISLPKPSKQDGFVVNLRGHIYFFGYECSHDKHSVFQCYDPEKNSWSSLEPFPGDSALGPIVATAVWGDTILFNLDCRNICAYDLSRKEWYEVGVDDELCYRMYGEAVVLEDTIYALAGFSNLVLSISIEKNQSDGDILLKFSSEIWVPLIEPMDFPDLDEKVFRRTKHLVRLGEDSFCLVQSYNKSSEVDGYQNLFVTCIKVDGKNFRIEKEFVNKVKLPVPGKFCEQFQVLLGFSLPRCKTTALKGESFNLEPFPASIPVQEEEDDPVQMVNALAQVNLIDEEDEGCPIYVKELRHNATVGQFMALKEFGPINKFEIQVRINNEGKRFALVEFESATSKQRALAALPIRTGNFSKISDMGLADLTPGGPNNRTLGVGGSSFCENKFKNQVEVSRSKTTCTVDSGGRKGEKLPDKVADLVSDFSGHENDLKNAEESN